MRLSSISGCLTMLMEGNSSCSLLCVQACKDGSLEDLKDALSQCDSQKINPFQERSPSLFHIASMTRECPLEILEELITVFRKLSKKSSRKGSGLVAFLRDSLTPEGYTALHCACKYNKLNYVYVFIKELRFYGSLMHSIGHTAVSRHTPFEVCCQFKCQRVASFLLQNCKGLYNDFSNGLIIAFGNGSVSHKEFIKEVCKVHKVTTQTLDSLCGKKLSDIVKFCIEEKLCKQEGKQLMQMAVSQGQTNLMKYHLDNHNYREICIVPDKSGNNLMHIACSEHQLDSINCLIAGGYAEMAVAKNKKRETPFDIAIHKHFEDIALLFEKELKLTLLHLYCLRDPAISEEKEIIEVFKTIIASTAQDVNLNSALRYACQNAHLFIVNNLLLVFESEIDLSEPNSNGDTPVHLLVRQLCLISKKIKANEESNKALKKRPGKKRLERQEEKIVFLLSVMMEHETFDPTILNAQNESAVFIFLTKLSYERFSHHEILCAFLEQAVTKYYKTGSLSKDVLNIVHHYCRYIYYVPKKGSGEYDINPETFVTFVQTLSSENSNFNPNEVDSEGNTCLHYAACNLCIPLVEYFLTFSDISINKVNYLNKSPLKSMQLSYKISKLVAFCKIYSLLMDKGASVDIHLPIDTKEGNTLLHLACIAKSYFLLKSLTSRASVKSVLNKQNKKGKSPIHLLCSNARKFVSVECFRILLNFLGIDVNLPSRSGDTPLSILTSHINSRKPIMYDRIKESILLLTEHSSFKPELYLTSDYLQIWCQVNKEDLFIKIFEIDKHKYLLNSVNYFSQNLLHIACLNFSPRVVSFLTKCSNSSVLFLQKDYFGNTPLASLCWRVCSAKLFVSYQEDIVLQSLDFLIKHESITCIIDELKIWLYYLNILPNFSLERLAGKMIAVLLKVIIVNENDIRNCLVSVPFDSLLAEFKYKETIEPVLKDMLTILNHTPIQNLLSKSIYQRKCLLIFCLNGNSLLHLACKFLIKDAVSTLISESIVLPEEVNDDEQTCLHVMIEEQNESRSSTPSNCFFEIFDLLKSNNLFHIEDVNGNTCLHLACNNKALSTLIKEIVYANPRLVTVKNKEGNTPLHIACKSGQLEAIDILLQQKCINLRSVNAKQQTVFHISIHDDKIINLLKTHSSYQDNILCMKDADGCTCLHVAYHYCYNSFFFLRLIPPCTILDMSLIADIVNIKNLKGQTMLHICPELILNTKITELDIAAVDNDGDTPLLNFMIMLCLANYSDSNFFFKESLLPGYDQCSPNCYSEMWEQVIKIPTFEMSINHISNQQFTLLHLACTHFNEDLILKEKIISSILCFPNCKTNIVNEEHRTPFHILAKLNPRMFDKLCKDKIIDLNVTDTNYGNTPLHVLRYSHYAAFLDLVNDDDNSCNSYGLANLFISDIAGNTALHTACMYNCAYYVHIFSKLMSNVNIQNKNGETPFHCLYRSSDNEVIDKATLLFSRCWEILVNHDSFDPNVQDACGMTILHYECQKSKPDFVLIKRLLSLNTTNTKLRNRQNQTCILVAEASSCEEKSYLLSLLKSHRSDNDFLAFSHLMSPYHGLYDFHKRCNCCLILHTIFLNAEKCKDALYLACEAVCPKSISKLLLRCRNKSVCNYVKQSGQTPLHSLALGIKKQADFIIQGYSDNLLKLRQKDLSFVRGKVNGLSKYDWHILLQCGINKQDDLGNTALHYVCEAQNMTMLRVLTSDSSCRFDIRNNAEKLPITIAYESGNRSFYLRFLIKYFRSQGDEGFADYYKTVLKDGATISMTPVKCILTGPPGAGKTTLKQRLLGEKLASTISTGVSDSPQVIAVRNVSHEQVSLPSSDMKWTPVDIRDQIEALLETVSLHAHNAIKETLARPPVLPSANYEISKNAKSSKHTNCNDTGNGSKKFKSGFNEWHEKQGKGKPKKFKSIEKQLKELRILANSVPSKKSKSNPHKFTIRELEKNPFVRVIDTGGQPELHELLPAFVSGPAINLIVFDLQIPLQDQIPIYCRSENEGDSVEYSSCINHEDMIMRSLSSIACLGYGQQMHFNEDGVSHSSTDPAAFLIGSHKDMVKEEVIKLVNEHLMSLIKTCDVDVHEIIQCYENCLFYPINGLDESSKVIDKLRQEIFNATKQFKSVEVPMTWLILSIKLQVLYEKKEINCVIDIEKCFKIANIECGFKNIDEMKNALWFYHYVMGTIMYFPYISELNEKVILDLQAIFDCVTKLINCCFVYGTVSERTEEEFTKFGTFFVRHLEKVLNSKDNKSKYPFSAREIIALLKHLHAIVAIDDDKYFMPTALKPVLLSQAHQDTTSCPPPLLISFACGYTPVGIFGSLVTHLLSNVKHNIECKLASDTRQYRNKIVLSVGSYHVDLTLTAWSRFIEIDFRRKCDLHISMADICQKVRLAIDESIEVISKLFNYKCKAKHSFGFPCNDIACNSLPVHPAICEVAIRRAKCVQTNNLIELSESQLIWFGIQQEEVVENCLTEDSLSEEIFQKTLEIDDMDDVFEKLDDLNEWKKLGLKLGLKYPTLERIERDKRVINDCKMEMLACWLKKQDKVKSPSWKQLIVVLCKMKETEIAKNIIKELRA